ncbi:MAG: tryptophan 7-halogenase [Alphaproteobacteria bacterium]|nr:tryptophan 7-halogenase [Alphaproteobacteria bacterium]
MTAVDQLQAVEKPARCDVLVVGGGPAGTTVAALLAERGRHVVVVEKDRHPRFHIGESLLPLNLPLFDRLGVRQEIERTSIHKYGVEFVSAYHGKSVTYDFARAWDKRFPYSFQVRRSTFDHILLKNAASKGAEIVEGCRVTAIDFPANESAQIEARDEDGRLRHWNAKFVVDASGRDTFLAGRLGFKERNRKNDTAAIFGHFTGARRLPGRAEGNISIIWFANGWFWLIPLLDGTTSVGAVCPAQFFKTRAADLDSFFMSIIASCPEVADRLKDARLTGSVTATGNYSYGTTRTNGRNFILVGDACAFIDPVFSTGVYVAMMTGFLGAEAIEKCLRNPQRSQQALKRYNAATRRALSAFTWFIYRIREPAMRNLFMSPRNWFRIEEAVLSLLAGDIFDGSPVRARLLIFKAIFYVTKFSHLRHRIPAWRRLWPDPRGEVAR